VVAPVVEHAAALAGLVSMNTIPVANNPANKTGTTTLVVAFEDRTKLTDTSFVWIVSRLKNPQARLSTYGQIMAISGPE
jgi:hypothetical protein